MSTAPKPYHPAILLILNCEKYADKRNKQRKTWLRKMPSWLPYYHVIGRPALQVSYEFDNTERILYVPVADDYCALPQKTLAALTAVASEFNFEYVFKTDDDQTLLTDPNTFFGILKNTLGTRSPIAHYGGFSITVAAHISRYHLVHKELPANLLLDSGTYCNGRFYLLSHRAVSDLASKSASFISACRANYSEDVYIDGSYYFEDYAVGKLLDPTLKTGLLHLQTNKHFVDM